MTRSGVPRTYTHLVDRPHRNVHSLMLSNITYEWYGCILDETLITVNLFCRVECLDLVSLDGDKHVVNGWVMNTADENILTLGINRELIKQLLDRVVQSL